MNKFFLYIFLVLATVHGFSVCRAAERVHCEPLTSLLGTKIDCDFTKEFSKGVIFNLKIVRASDGSYNIGFEGLNKDFYKESFICVDKVLNYVRSSHVASSSDSEKVLYFGVVRCTQNALYIDDIAIDTESSSGPQKKTIYG